jgi:hypothetical protein
MNPQSSVGDAPYADAAAPGGSGPHGVPTAVELLEAVREFLTTDVLTATEGRVKFHTRVAANVLAMVEREATLGPDQAVAHAARLQALGYKSDQELAIAIRSGALDDRWSEVKGSVWEAVHDKLAVANPTYADEPRTD